MVLTGNQLPINLTNSLQRLMIIIMFKISLKKHLLPVTIISKLNNNRLPVFKNYETITEFIGNGFKPWKNYTPY